jgi:hypothetical protein
MISDPLTLKALVGGSDVDVAGASTLTTRDIALGRSVRSGNIVHISNPEHMLGGKFTMTISHSESKENKGQITDRASVRLECLKTLETGESSVAQATLTVSSPRLGFGAEDIVSVVATLLGTLLVDQESSLLDFGILSRVLAGEP